MAGLIRSLAFLVPTWALSAAFRIGGLSARFDLLDDLATSLLLYVGPFWLGDLLWRSRLLERRRIGRQIANGLIWAVAVQGGVALAAVLRSDEAPSAVRLASALGPSLLAVLAGAWEITGPGRGQGSPKGKRWRRAGERAALLSLVLALSGLVLQAADADRWRITAPLTFALPPALAATFGLLGALAALAVGRRKIAGLALVAALIAAAAALVADHAPRECRGTGRGGSTRVVAWNAGHRLTARTRRQLQSLDADLLLIAEGDEAGSWTEAFPRRSVCEPGQGLVMISRWPFSHCSLEPLAPKSWVGLGRLEGGPFSAVAVVDVDGNPLRGRGEPLASLARLFGDRYPELSLIGGDFNTPRRAVAFAPLRKTHRNAFEEAGSGWAPTWPRPLPVLDIDQIWLAAGLQAECAWSPPVGDGDHRPLLVSLAEDAGRAAGSGRAGAPGPGKD